MIGLYAVKLRDIGPAVPGDLQLQRFYAQPGNAAVCTLAVVQYLLHKQAAVTIPCCRAALCHLHVQVFKTVRWNCLSLDAPAVIQQMITDDRNRVGMELGALLFVKGLSRFPESDTPLLVQIIIFQTSDAFIDTDKSADRPPDTIQMVFYEFIPSVHAAAPFP